MATPEAEAIVSTSRALDAPGQYMCGLTWDGNTLWHSDQDAGKIYAVSPTDGAVLREFACPLVRADLAFDGRLLGQVGGHPKRIVLVDPGGGEVTGTKPVLPSSGRLTGIEFGPEGLWMCLRAPTVVQLRDYATMTVRAEYPVGGESPSGLTYVNGLIVHGDFDSALLRVTDAQTGKPVAAARVPGRPTGMTWDGKQLWYCDFAARAFRALDLDALLAG